jgi:DNA-directed RNA polymerase subunit E'/Rpb7
MFIINEFVRKICLRPNSLVLENNNAVIKNEIDKLEGMLFGHNGFIIHVIDYKSVGNSLIDNETGSVIYNVKFDAITFKLLQDEVLYAVVFFVNEYGVYCDVGVTNNVFISHVHISNRYKYNQIENVWTGPSTINSGSIVLIKVINVKVETNKLVALAVLVDDP